MDGRSASHSRVAKDPRYSFLAYEAKKGRHLRCIGVVGTNNQQTKVEQNMEDTYSQQESDHNQLRSQFSAEQNAELDGTRANGKNWVKLGYAAIALICAYIGFLLITG